MKSLNYRLSTFARASLLSATSIIAIAASANARADDILASGLYAGLHTGVANGHFSGTADYRSYSGALNDHSSLGGLVGLQLGYNLHDASGLLLGGEVSASFGSYDETTEQVNFAGSGRTLTYERELSDLVLAQGKLGFTSGKLAVFGLGGLAVAHGKISGGVSDSEGFSGSSTFTGWTLGAGAEWQVADKLTLGATYNFVSLDGETVQNDKFNVGQDLDAHVAKLVLNYHF